MNLPSPAPAPTETPTPEGNQPPTPISPSGMFDRRLSDFKKDIGNRTPDTTEPQNPEPNPGRQEGAPDPAKPEAEAEPKPASSELEQIKAERDKFKADLDKINKRLAKSDVKADVDKKAISEKVQGQLDREYPAKKAEDFMREGADEDQAKTELEAHNKRVKQYAADAAEHIVNVENGWAQVRAEYPVLNPSHDDYNQDLADYMQRFFGSIAGERFDPKNAIAVSAANYPFNPIRQGMELYEMGRADGRVIKADDKQEELKATAAASDTGGVQTKTNEPTNKGATDLLDGILGK